MNKMTCMLVIGILIAPGCFKRSKKASDASTPYEGLASQSVFDEDVESFVLEDDHNPFAPEEGDSVRLIETSDMWSPAEHRGELETIYFDFDQHSIRPDQKDALNRTLNKIKKATTAGKVITVEGHACTSGGSAQYNLALSHKRANAVRKHLIEHGIPHHQLKVVGRGSEQCKVMGGDQEQQAPNRRVEFFELETEA